MKLAIELDGRPRTVELTRVDDRLCISLDGERLDADAVEVARGIYSVLLGGESFEVRLEPQADTSGTALRVIVGGRELSARIRDPRQWRRLDSASSEAAGRQQVAAPMPGKIIRVLVKQGDSVEAKQGLLVVEAMKMQNEIRSPKTGRVERLMATEGQAVNAGEILAIIA